MTKPIRWGILGTSYISEVMARAIISSTEGELTAIASRNKASANTFAEKFSIPKAYDNQEALLSDDTIDAIYVGLPNHLHKEWILRIANAKKHILCEKPLVISAKEAEEVISVVETNNVFCMEALMYRCHPFTQKMVDLISSNIIGKITLFNAVYNANIAAVANPTAGGAIRNLGCYPISLIRLLAGSEPIEIKAMGRMNSSGQADHQASVLLKFDNNIMAMVATADDLEMYWQFDIYGSEGNLKILTNPWLPETNSKIMITRHDQPTVEITVTADKSLYTYQIDAVNNEISLKENAKDNIISLQDSLGNVTVLENWLEQVSACDTKLLRSA